MELSNEDSLRLNVMLSNANAIRIDENKMMVYGLSDDKEFSIQLNPNCKTEKYLKMVRELLSTFALGSPKGYPVFISRWIRMDQLNNIDLSKLLLLGEPEAIVAIAGSATLTNQLAKKAWWASPTAENARFMLKNPNIAQDTMGKVLAQYLFEFLPFETESKEILNTVPLILQRDLINQSQKDKLWLQGKRKKVYRLGFLLQCLDQLPNEAPQRSDLETIRQFIEKNQLKHPLTDHLIKCLSQHGQSFIKTCEEVLLKPGDQDMVSTLFTVMENLFSPCQLEMNEFDQVQDIIDYTDTQIDKLINSSNLNHSLLSQHFMLDDIKSLIILAQLKESHVMPILVRSSAIGSVLRKQLNPIFSLILIHIKNLQTAKS